MGGIDSDSDSDEEGGLSLSAEAIAALRDFALTSGIAVHGIALPFSLSVSLSLNQYTGCQLQKMLLVLRQYECCTHIFISHFIHTSAFEVWNFNKEFDRLPNTFLIYSF